MSDVEANLYSRFWKYLETSISEELSELGVASTWSVRLIESPRASFGNRYQGIDMLRSAASGENRLNLAIYLNGSVLLCGVGFCKQQPLRLVLPPDWRGPDDWWIGYYDFGHRLPSRPFLLDVAADVVSVGQPLVDSLIAVLKDHADVVIAADMALQAVGQ